VHDQPNEDLALDVVGVTAGYQQGRPVFVDASFSVPSGGLVHVQGPNGSGKSTLMELASGYLRPWSGVVRVGGLAAGSDEARRRRRVCRTQPALYPQMTLHDHLVFEFDTVFLDEPFNGLDGESADTMVAEIRHWSETKTVLLVAHSLPASLYPDVELNLESSGRSYVSGGSGTQDTARSSG
jgi:ABC-2 type transport system ATP-binding protein